MLLTPNFSSLVAMTLVRDESYLAKPTEVPKDDELEAKVRTQANV